MSGLFGSYATQDVATFPLRLIVKPAPRGYQLWPPFVEPKRPALVATRTVAGSAASTAIAFAAMALPAYGPDKNVEETGSGAVRRQVAPLSPLRKMPSAVEA